MASTADVIVAAIKAYVGKKREYREWYVGIAEKPKRRLFDEHGVTEENGESFRMRATDVEEARRAEKTLIAAGFQGHPGGGTDDSTAVYAYRITPTTSQG